MVPRWGVERPPLNLAYLARYLREAGLRVAVRDFNVEAHKCLEGTDLQRLWTIDTEEQGDQGDEGARRGRYRARRFRHAEVGSRGDH